MGSRTINSPSVLKQFRGAWSGSAVLGLLPQCRGRLLVSWPVGVGKSFNIDQAIDATVKGDEYDLVIALFPTNQVIAERTIIRKPDPAVKLVHLSARPNGKCGSLDIDWSSMESRNLSLLGKTEICEQCPNTSGCFWPEQFSEDNLEGAQVVIAAHAQLKINPFFVDLIAERAGAAKVLVIIDEGSFTTISFRQTVKSIDLIRLTETVEAVDGNDWECDGWLAFLEQLQDADNDSLRVDHWGQPAMSAKMTMAVQQKGVELFGDEFNFPAYALTALEKSPAESREKRDNGDLSFALVPEVNADFIVYSGTTHSEVLKYRLGDTFVDYFKDWRFYHPETRIYNISSKIGMKKYFHNNSKQLFDFFAKLVALRVADGKRVLLISKKCFLNECIKGLQERFNEMGVAKRVVNATLSGVNVSDISVIPIINYGIIGINDFENFDCAYCLNGYFVNENLVSNLLQDTLAEDIRVPIEITRSLIQPRRRSARVRNQKDRIYDVHHLAPAILHQLEVETVLQAVGRVRPYTSPTEIIMFLFSDLPDGYTKEFGSLESARQYFGVISDRKSRLTATVEAVQRAKTMGLKQREAVIETGYSLSTVQRYWNT